MMRTVQLCSFPSVVLQFLQPVTSNLKHSYESYKITEHT